MRVRMNEERKLTVVDAGRGNWVISRDDLACGYELRGFSGESHLYIFVEGWQSGHTYATVVRCLVDSVAKVACCLLGKTAGEVTSGLNDLIHVVGITD